MEMKERFKVVRSYYEDGGPRVGVLDTETNQVAGFTEQTPVYEVASALNAGSTRWLFVTESLEQFNAPMKKHTPKRLTPVEVAEVWDDQVKNLDEMLWSDLDDETRDQVVKVCDYFFGMGK